MAIAANQPALGAPRSIPAAASRTTAGAARVSQPVGAATVFFLVANSVDLGGALGLKYVSFGVLVLAVLYHVGRVRIDTIDLLTTLVLFVVWPLFSVLWGVMNGAGTLEAVAHVMPFLPAFVFLPAVTLVGGDRVIEWTYRLLVAVAAFQLAANVALIVLPDKTPVFSLLSMIGVYEPSNRVGARLNGFVGVRGLGLELAWLVYFKLTLFYVFGFSVAVYRRSPAVAVLFFLALMLAVSRSGVVLCGVVFAYHSIVGREGVAGKVVGATILATVVALAAFFGSGSRYVTSYYGAVMSIVTGEDVSSGVRVSDLSDIWDHIEANPHILVVGQGAGTTFFSTVRQAEVADIELDHLNMIRKFGLPYALAVCAFILGPALRMAQDRRRGPVGEARRGLGVAAAALFVAVGTNPVLMTPLFLSLAVAIRDAAKPSRL